jgi:hypothetical protein
MNKGPWFAFALSLTAPLAAQDAGLLPQDPVAVPQAAPDPSYIPQATQDVGYESAFSGPGSIGSGEPLFRYDDQERWKHGYIQNMPYYEGYHSFRPYNYHHVFSQAQTSAGWGMPATMPYSQQFWHRYENMVDLSRGDHTPVAPYIPPAKEFDHYPKPLRSGAMLTPAPVDTVPMEPSPVPAPQFPPQATAAPMTPSGAWTGVAGGNYRTQVR